MTGLFVPIDTGDLWFTTGYLEKMDIFSVTQTGKESIMERWQGELPTWHMINLKYVMDCLGSNGFY